MVKEKMLEPVFKDKIRLDIIFNTIVENKRKFFLPVFLTAVLTAIISLCIPRYYKVQVLLAPEYSNAGSSMSGFGGLASMIGINLGTLNSSDAIAPLFYPDVMKSTDFLVPMMDVQVKTLDGDFEGRYVDYIIKKNKAPFWSVALEKMKNLFKDKETLNTNKGYVPNPFQLTKIEDKIVRGIASSINCVVDKKTEVITITTTAQDPLVAALLADTVKQKLQDFIIKYRTKKAKTDLDHLTVLCNDAQKKYEYASKLYAEFVESHTDIVRQSYLSEQARLKDDMQSAYTVYNSFLQQKVMAESKLLERTPAFTTLQNASVPVKHAGPKRMITVLAMSFFAFVITTAVLLYKRKK